MRYWLRRYGLETRRRRTRRALALAALQRGERRFLAECRRHGLVDFIVYGDGRSRCARCNVESVNRRRQENKRALIEEAGGRCLICGYDRHPAALQFHHLDPARKAFGISEAGATRGLERSREEARKCVLLCANCHAEVEAGVAVVPPEATKAAVAE